MRAASCWSVEVMNGAYGRRRYGFSSTRVTSNGRSSSRAARPRAPCSSRCTTPAFGRTRPVSGSKSLPVAMRSPSRAISVAPNVRGPSPILSGVDRE